MSRLVLAAIALAVSFSSSLTAVSASADVPQGTGDISPDDPLREAKIADRKRVVELNTAQARHVEARDRGRKSAPTPAAQNRYRIEQDRYRAAQAKHRADMAAWQRQVAACRNGDWSQCDR